MDKLDEDLGLADPSSCVCSTMFLYIVEIMLLKLLCLMHVVV